MYKTVTISLVWFLAVVHRTLLCRPGHSIRRFTFASFIVIDLRVEVDIIDLER